MASAGVALQKNPLPLRNEALERARRRERMRLWAIRLVVFAILLGAWEYFGQRASPLMFAPLSLVLESFKTFIENGELWRYLSSSLQNMLVGTTLGTTAGLVLGLLMARYRVLDLAIDTYITMLFSLPMIAIAPLLQRWLGPGPITAVTIVFLFTFFPMVLNTYQGVKHVDAKLLEVARSFCSSERQLWRDVVLPGSLPFIIVGIRFAITRGLLATVVSDLYASASGVGFMIMRYTSRFQPENVFVPVLTLGIVGITLVAFSQWLEKRIVPWAFAGEER
jgi:NitT/TauT family transport system permease protein